MWQGMDRWKFAVFAEIKIYQFLQVSNWKIIFTSKTLKSTCTPNKKYYFSALGHFSNSGQGIRSGDNISRQIIPCRLIEIKFETVFFLQKDPIYWADVNLPFFRWQVLIKTRLLRDKPLPRVSQPQFQFKIVLKNLQIEVFEKLKLPLFIVSLFLHLTYNFS